MPLDGVQGNNAEARLLADERFLRKIAYMYYEDGHSQEAIAEMEYCSRQTVSKALQRAKERGIVRIAIVPDLRAGYLRNLAREVRTQLGLADLILVPGRSFDPASDGVVHDEVVIEITSAAAEYLDQLLTDSDILAVSGGRTFMRNVVRYLKPTRTLPHLQVVSTIGFVEARPNFGDANLIAYDIAEAYGGQHIWYCTTAFYPPSQIATVEEMEHLVREVPLLNAAYELYDRANVVMMGLWTPHTNDDMVMRGILSEEQIEMIEQFHPVADINHWVFDAEGRCINQLLDPSPYSLTGFQIPLLKDRIRDNKTKVILVAGGSNVYVPALKAVLKAKLANILITDHVTAQALLQPD
jgi:DNA-binding transcriptional regulator LsrR (DeoR family)